jgi:hypothetical protein
MAGGFAELVEEIRHRSSEEKAELLFLLQRDLIEARREEFAVFAAEARQEYEDGRLKFTSDVAELKRRMGAA